MPPTLHYTPQHTTTQHLVILITFHFQKKGTKALALSNDKQNNEQASYLEAVAILKETSRYHATTFTAPQLKAIVKTLSWPEKFLFPGTPNPLPHSTPLADTTTTSSS